MADSKIVLYDFWASWCGPCKVMHPILEEIDKDYSQKVEIKKINVDETENQDIVMKYQINAMPTYIIEKDGQVINQYIGAQSKKTLTDALNNALLSQVSHGS